jgi:hypothetical protein
MSNSPAAPPREELAHVLALLIASKGRVAAAEWQALANTNASRQVGVTAERLSELIDNCMIELGPYLLEHRWLSSENLNQVDRILARVTDVDQRLLVCRLAASVLGSEEHVSGYDDLVLDHALARWHVDKSTVFPQRRRLPAPGAA